MAGDWIKVEQVTPDKPEVFAIAAILKIDPDAVFGKLMRFWIWADQQSPDGKVNMLTDAMIDRVTHQKGFAAAMRSAGWLNDDGLPNFERHNGKTAKARAETNRRVANFRQRGGKGNAEETPYERERNINVTPEPLQKPLPEKRREEIDAKEHLHTSTVIAGIGIGGARVSLNGPSDLENADLRESAKRVLRFLNDKTGKKFPFVEGNLGFIVARLAEGASEQDCKTVIARKRMDWFDNPEMRQFLRPATIFDPVKFAQYQGECVAPTPEASHA